jgi:hypothetical protein
MGNPEHDDEIDAKNVVHNQTSHRFEHADHFGGVDYRSLDGAVAMEVTTVTDGAQKAATKPRAALLNTETPSPETTGCWWVTIDDEHPRLKGLEGRVIGTLPALEAEGVTEYWSWSGYTLLRAHPALQDTVGTLAREHVEHAVQTPEMCQRDGNDHVHKVFWSTSGAFTASGSDSALTAIESALNGKPDNFQKLADADATTTVLFVWVDRDTDGSITRPLHDAVGERWDHFGVPSRGPALDGDVDELWIVHRQTRRGWRWAAGRWSALENL